LHLFFLTSIGGIRVNTTSVIIKQNSILDDDGCL